jgi:hypothetical protein
LKDGGEKEQTTVNQRNTDDLKLELQKDFETWFKTITTKITAVQFEKVKFNNRTIEPIVQEEFKQSVGVADNSVVIVSNEENKPKTEIKAGIKAEPQITAVSPNSKSENSPLHESELDGYHQLVCYFCGKPLMGNDWEQSSFSENKPAHKKCCEERRAQSKQRIETPDFEAKCQPPDDRKVS